MGRDSSREQQDRRTGKDRRQFTFTLHIPERRRGDDRRNRTGKKESPKTSSQSARIKSDDSEPTKKS